MIPWTHAEWMCAHGSAVCEHMYVCLWVHVSMNVHTGIYANVLVSVCICMNECVHVCTLMCASVCMHILVHNINTVKLSLRSHDPQSTFVNYDCFASPSRW